MTPPSMLLAPAKVIKASTEAIVEALRETRRQQAELRLLNQQSTLLHDLLKRIVAHGLDIPDLCAFVHIPLASRLEYDRNYIQLTVLLDAACRFPSPGTMECLSIFCWVGRWPRRKRSRVEGTANFWRPCQRALTYVCPFIANSSIHFNHRGSSLASKPSLLSRTSSAVLGPSGSFTSGQTSSPYRTLRGKLFVWPLTDS